MKINISWDWNLYSEKGIIRWKLPGFVYCCHEKFSPLSNIERWNVCDYLVLPCPHMLPGNECVLMIHKFRPLYRHGSRNEASNFNTESVKRELSDCTGRTRWTEICTSMYYPKSSIWPAHYSHFLIVFANTCLEFILKDLSRNWLIEIDERKEYFWISTEQNLNKMYCIYSLYLSWTWKNG